MTETKDIEITPSIDLKQISIKAGSGIALYWAIDKMLPKEGLMEYAAVGLTGGVGLGIVAPILNSLINGTDFLGGIAFNGKW